MTSPSRVEPGYVEIKKLILNTGVGEPVNLTQMATDVNIYESIFQPYVYAEIVLVDSLGLANKFKLDELTVDIEFTVPGVEVSAKYTLSVMDRKGDQTGNQDKTKVYTMACISKEIDDKSANDAGRYFVKANLGNLVGATLEALGSKKNILVEPTDGIVDVKLPNVKPFQLIDWARRRALSLTHESHSYVFFENKYGYRFTTIEKLFEDGVARIGDKIFQYDSAVNIDVAGTNWRNILYRDAVSLGKGLKQQLLEGNLAIARELNLEQCKYTYTEKRETDYNFATLDPNGFTSTTNRKNKFKDTKPSERMMVTSDEDDVGYKDKILALQAFIPRLLSNISRVYIYGDPSITAGDVIKCNIPDVDGLTDKKTEYSKTLSGNYLVSKCRHMISLAGPPTYTQALEILKDGYGQGKVD